MIIKNKKIKLLTILFTLISPFKEYFVKNKGKKNSLLIIRTDSLGDFILFLPTLIHIISQYHDYEITLLLPMVCQDFKEKIKNISNYIFYENKRRDFLYLGKLLYKIHISEYKTIIYPQYTANELGDLIVYISKATERIGIENILNKSRKELLKRKKIYTNLINISDNIELEVEKNSHFLNTLGIKTSSNIFPQLEIDNQYLCAADELLAIHNIDNKKYCIIVPGAGEKYRIWPIYNYKKIIEFINKQNITVVLCGSINENYLAKQILTVENDKIINLIGKTDLYTLAALIKKSLFYFGGETGILHLAASVNVPILCLMGGGHWGRFFPYGNPKYNRIVFDKNMNCKNDDWKCSQIYGKNKASPCIRNINVEDVKIELSNLINDAVFNLV